MRKIIDRCVYDTEKAELIAEWSNDFMSSDFRHQSEELYRTQRGNWFLVGSGGPMSDFHKPAGSGGSVTGTTIMAKMSEDEVLTWFEEKDFANLAEKYFPDKIKEA